MILLALPDRQPRRLAFFLAMEEWAARELPAGQYLFSWIVNPTVICGRCQDIPAEVNLEYCRANNIDIVRRRSGGGCVYADRDNIMMSLITDETDINKTFAAYTEMVAGQLRQIGIDARATGRNDIVVGERKISGNAFYHLPGRSIVHGTMLYDIDFERMTNAITPSRAKLVSKQVVSVASHVTMAKEHRPDLSFQEFHDSLISGLTDSVITLTDKDIARVSEIEREYYRPEWLWGRGGDASQRRQLKSTRIDGVGEIRLATYVDADSLISGFDITGDFFLTDDLDSTLFNPLIGVAPKRADLERALADIDVSRTIRGLSTDEFISIVINSLTVC